jgi:hypothetical protein
MQLFTTLRTSMGRTTRWQCLTSATVPRVRPPFLSFADMKREPVWRKSCSDKQMGVKSSRRCQERSANGVSRRMRIPPTHQTAKSSLLRRLIQPGKQGNLEDVQISKRSILSITWRTTKTKTYAINEWSGVTLKYTYL